MPENFKGAKMWVVIPVGWEYNDEYYSQSNFKRPNTSFTLKEMADDYKGQLDVKFFRNNCEGEYFGGFISYEDDYEGDINALRKKYGKVIGISDLDIRDHKLLSDEDIIDIIKIMNLKFHEVVEVSIMC